MGLLRAKMKAAFTWPEPVEPLPLVEVLGPRGVMDSPDRLPPRTQNTGRANVTSWLRAARKDISVSERVIDADASRKLCGKPTELSPCLTRSRARLPHECGSLLPASRSPGASFDQTGARRGHEETHGKLYDSVGG